MATSIWYCDGAGSDSNSGGSSATTARVTCATAAIVNAAKTLTQAGATFQTSGVLVTDAVNVQVAGVSTIFEIASVDSETQLTLVTAPADGTYGAKIGGARALVAKVVQAGAGQNAVLASGDTVFAAPGTYTENAITILAGVALRGNGGMATIDGTGGGAGSDILTYNGTGLYDIILANAVDKGFTRSGGGGGVAVNVRATACGGVGLEIATGATFCSARSCVGIGISLITAGVPISFCEAGDGSSDGFNGAVNIAPRMHGCLAYDNAGDGCDINPNTSGAVIVGNTFEGNTGAGLKSTGQLGNATPGSSLTIVANNLFTNNLTGVDSSVAQTAPRWVDYNLYFGNGTPRVNFDTGTNDKSTDPSFTDATNDDYSIKSTGGAYKAGYSPFKNPTLNALNIGAVPGPGSSEVVSSSAAGGSGLFPGYG